jgi:hypothetical protein
MRFTPFGVGGRSGKSGRGQSRGRPGLRAVQAKASTARTTTAPVQQYAQAQITASIAGTLPALATAAGPDVNTATSLTVSPTVITLQLPQG